MSKGSSRTIFIGHQGSYTPASQHKDTLGGFPPLVEVPDKSGYVTRYVAPIPADESGPVLPSLYRGPYEQK